MIKSLATNQEHASGRGMAIEIVSEPVTLDELRGIARQQFGDFVKAVVDVGRGAMAIGGGAPRR